MSTGGGRLLLSTGQRFTAPGVCRKCQILEKLLTLSVSKRHLAVGKLYKFCVCVCVRERVCCNAHLMKQGPVRGEDKPEEIQSCSHWWKVQPSGLLHLHTISSLFIPFFSPSFLSTPYFLSLFPFNLSTFAFFCPSASHFTACKTQQLLTFLFFSLLLSFSLYPRSPSMSLLSLAYLPTACIVIQCVYHRHCCRDSQPWALGPSALLIFIPAV